MTLMSEHAKLLGAALGYLEAEAAVDALRDRYFEAIADGERFDPWEFPGARQTIMRLQAERQILQAAADEARDAHFARTAAAHRIKTQRLNDWFNQ